jgi:hypothetical protein
MAILPLVTVAVFCGTAASASAKLVQVLTLAGNFPAKLAIENNEGYICGGLPYERRLNKISIDRRR